MGYVTFTFQQGCVLSYSLVISGYYDNNYANLLWVWEDITDLSFRWTGSQHSRRDYIQESIRVTRAISDNTCPMTLVIETMREVKTLYFPYIPYEHIPKI